MKKSLQLLALIFTLMVPSMIFAADDPELTATDSTDGLVADDNVKDTTTDDTELTTTDTTDGLIPDDNVKDSNDTTTDEKITSTLSSSNYMDYLPYALIAGSVILLISIIGILLSKKKGDSEVTQNQDTSVPFSNPVLEPSTNLENIPTNLQNETKTDNLSQPKPTLADIVNQPKQSNEEIQQPMFNPSSVQNTTSEQESLHSKDLEELNNSNQDIKDIIQDNPVQPVEAVSTNMWSAPETKPLEQPEYTPTESTVTPTEINSSPMPSTPTIPSFQSPSTQDMSTEQVVESNNLIGSVNSQNTIPQESNSYPIPATAEIPSFQSTSTQDMNTQALEPNNYPPVPNTDSSFSQIMPESPTIDLQGLVNKEIEGIKTIPEETNPVQTPVNSVDDTTKSEDLPEVPPMM